MQVVHHNRKQAPIEKIICRDIDPDSVSPDRRSGFCIQQNLLNIDDLLLLAILENLEVLLGETVHGPTILVEN